MKLAGLLILLTGLALGCSKSADPTTLLAKIPPPAAVPTPIPPGAAGVILKFTRSGDFVRAVINVWVQDSLGANVKTLRACSGSANYDCPFPGPCPSEGVHWPLFWPLSNDGALTDGNTSATVVFFGTNTEMTHFWNWTDHSGSLVADGTYTLRVEVSGSEWDPTTTTAAAEAHVDAVKNTSTGSATGTLDANFYNQLQAISATWNP